MMHSKFKFVFVIAFTFYVGVLAKPVAAQSANKAHFSFDGSLENRSQNGFSANGTDLKFGKGLGGKALKIQPMRTEATAVVGTEDLFNPQNSFSIEFWIRTTLSPNQHMILLSSKSIDDFSLRSQKKRGWCFGAANGSWSWNIGSGERRLTYYRDNGRAMPVNDGRWHQLAMTFDRQTGLVRLFFDGDNWVTYNVTDNGEFDFNADEGLLIGPSVSLESGEAALELVRQGASNLQKLVDQYNELSATKLEPEQLVELVVSPDRFFESENPDSAKDAVDEAGTRLDQLARKLMNNPYTIHQAPSFMEVAPLQKIFRLGDDDKIKINKRQASKYASKTRLVAGDFAIDELVISKSVLSPDEITRSYQQHFQPKTRLLTKHVDNVTAGAFNIFHGGIHFSIEDHGWDSRMAIVDLLRREKVDLIMMQETYSNGDFIAAELGYYLATTIDWDNLNQGANISVISRYPIEEVTVPPKSTFMNVSAKVKLSSEQQILVMSNWYGMRNFEDVFTFHESRFANADKIPILFGGDFNAVPDGDGGNNLANRLLLKNGFVDSYRESFPDVNKSAGHTHRSGRRIDQLYFKGESLKHVATDVLSNWPTGFPSDHYLIKSRFELK